MYECIIKCKYNVNLHNIKTVQEYSTLWVKKGHAVLLSISLQNWSVFGGDMDKSMFVVFFDLHSVHKGIFWLEVTFWVTSNSHLMARCSVLWLSYDIAFVMWNALNIAYDIAWYNMTLHWLCGKHLACGICWTLQPVSRCNIAGV